MPDEAPRSAKHITLIMGICPTIGVLDANVISGPVTNVQVIDFLTSLMGKLPPCAGESRKKRALIYENAKIHKNKDVEAFLNCPTLRQILEPVALPPYSPFLNPIEETFTQLKSNLWRRRNDDETATDESEAFLKKDLLEEISLLNQRQILQHYAHTCKFHDCKAMKRSMPY
jgi:transposase